jgi:hypothetical protein
MRKLTEKELEIIERFCRLAKCLDNTHIVISHIKKGNEFFLASTSGWPESYKVVSPSDYDFKRRSYYGQKMYKGMEDIIEELKILEGAKKHQEKLEEKYKDDGEPLFVI